MQTVPMILFKDERICIGFNGVDFFRCLMFQTFMNVFFYLAACPVGTFGYLCSYTCHCAFNTPCDPDTGACFGECAPGFAGKPYCQLGN